MDNKQHWPAFFYGPNGASQVFNNPLEVPEGWHDHPSKVGDSKAKTEIPGYAEAVAAANGEDRSEDADLDDEGGAGDDADIDEDGDGDDSSADTAGDGSGKVEAYELPDIKKITKPEIIEQLKARKVKFNSSWNEKRLYDLLADNLEKSAE